MDIAAALKQQMLGVLIDALGKPANSPGQSAAATPAFDLATGETLTATVTAVRPDGSLVLNVKGQMVQADIRGTTLPEPARQPGAVLQLKVETAGPTPRLAFVAVETSLAAPRKPATSASAITTALATAPEIATATAPTVRLANPQTPPQTVVPDPVAQVVSRAAAEAATRQGSAAPLYADLAALVGRSESPLPRPVAVLAQAILSIRLDGEKPIRSGDLKQAIVQSGVLQEASLARGAPAVLDAKALLTTLRDLLRSDAQRFVPPPSETEPPRRDGAVIAQKAALPLLAVETDPKVITTTLAREADQAVERLKLHQIASLPENRPATPDAARPQQLSFEIPVALGQQTAMAGFRIEREKRRARDADQPVDIWGVRFAIDADMLGAVHAHVRLSGHTVSVSLWAEDAITHGIFVASMPMLEAALADNAMDIGELIVFSGRPAEPKRANSGHFLDRSS